MILQRKGLAGDAGMKFRLHALFLIQTASIEGKQLITVKMASILSRIFRLNRVPVFISVSRIIPTRVCALELAVAEEYTQSVLPK